MRPNRGIGYAPRRVAIGTACLAGSDSGDANTVIPAEAAVTK